MNQFINIFKQNMDETTQDKREYVMAVGNIEKSIATLVDLDYNVL